MVSTNGRILAFESREAFRQGYSLVADAASLADTLVTDGPGQWLHVHGGVHLLVFAVSVKSSNPSPDWAVKAHAAGWTPPKGWKPE